MEGVPCVDFHGFIFSLAKAYLEKVHQCSIQEEKVHTMIELDNKEETFSTKDHDESKTYNVALLQAGLSRWRKESMEAIKAESKMKEE